MRLRSEAGGGGAEEGVWGAGEVVGERGGVGEREKLRSGGRGFESGCGGIAVGGRSCC